MLKFKPAFQVPVVCVLLMITSSIKVSFRDLCGLCLCCFNGAMMIAGEGGEQLSDLCSAHM